jgi:hypothetical protein
MVGQFILKVGLNDFGPCLNRVVVGLLPALVAARAAAGVTFPCCLILCMHGQHVYLSIRPTKRRRLIKSERNLINASQTAQPSVIRRGRRREIYDQMS